MSNADRKVGPVVSAAHLAAGAMPALSEIEFAMTVMSHSFERWMVRYRKHGRFHAEAA